MAGIANAVAKIGSQHFRMRDPFNFLRIVTLDNRRLRGKRQMLQALYRWRTILERFACAALSQSYRCQKWRPIAIRDEVALANGAGAAMVCLGQVDRQGIFPFSNGTIRLAPGCLAVTGWTNNHTLPT